MISLICGNVDVIPLRTGSVHAVIVSVPYYGQRDYEIKGQIGAEATAAEYIMRIAVATADIWRVLRDDGSLWLNVGDAYAKRTEDLWGQALEPKQLIGIPFHIMRQLQKLGWIVRSFNIWTKPNAMPEPSRDRPGRDYEAVMQLTKRPSGYFYDAEAVRQNNGRRNLRQTWSIPTRGYSGPHVAPFPPDLVKLCMKAATPEGGVCSLCGAPFQRQTRKGAFVRTRWAAGDDKTLAAQRQARGDGSGPDATSAMVRGGYYRKETIGWVPGCECNADPKPAVVLDPCVGSGTVLEVARELGRDGIGVDLSWDILTGDARRRLYLDRLYEWNSGNAIGGAETAVDTLPLFKGFENES